MFEEAVTSIVLTDLDDVLAVVLGSGVILWEPRSDNRLPFVFRLEGWPKVRLNDARADPWGHLWAGSMRNNVNSDGSSGEAGGQEGVLYRIAPTGEVTTHRCNIGISNTIAWSPDRRSFYFGDSLANTIWHYDCEPRTGEIFNDKPFFFGYSRGLPDGSTVDSKGYLWNCRFHGSCIVRVAPTGIIDRVVEIPAENVTMCTFGDKDRSTLYITTACAESAPWDRLAGSLFAFDAGVTGQPENAFNVSNYLLKST